MLVTQCVKEFTRSNFPCLHKSRQPKQEKGQNVWIRPGSNQEQLSETVENTSAVMREKPGTRREEGQAGNTLKSEKKTVSGK